MTMTEEATDDTAMEVPEDVLTDGGQVHNIIINNAGNLNEEKTKKRRRKNRRRNKKNINVRTLFVGGLPMDTKPREIYLMFRRFTGYQGSILKSNGKEGKTASPVAFVTFESREQAEEAKKELHGVRFDEQVPRTLKIEFAKSNTKDATKAIATTPSIDGVPVTGNTEFQVIEPPTVPLDNCGSTTNPWPQPTWSQNSVMYTDVNGNAVTTLPLPSSPPHNASFIPNPELATNGDSPCTTLFVANLGHNASEEEIKELFLRIPSFRRLKMHRNKGMKPVVFVQYHDLMAAIHARSLFNGQMLLSSENGGIRIEYAKRPMGELVTT